MTTFTDLASQTFVPLKLRFNIQQKKELLREAVAKKGFLLSLQALSTIMYYQVNDSLEVLKTVLSKSNGEIKRPKDQRRRF